MYPVGRKRQMSWRNPPSLFLKHICPLSTRGALSVALRFSCVSFSHLISFYLFFTDAQSIAKVIFVPRAEFMLENRSARLLPANALTQMQWPILARSRTPVCGDPLISFCKILKCCTLEILLLVNCITMIAFSADYEKCLGAKCVITKVFSKKIQEENGVSLQGNLYWHSRKMCMKFPGGQRQEKSKHIITRKENNNNNNTLKDHKLTQRLRLSSPPREPVCLWKRSQNVFLVIQ